jgi:Na+/H+ antiporter NhaD/arsenite permease-like protein
LVFFSAIIDNIPFVAPMVSLIKEMAPHLGRRAYDALWWALSLGVCLGGNGTLIGASANLAMAGIADRSGARFSLRSPGRNPDQRRISNLYLWLRYL